MITIRKSEDRGKANHGWLKSFHSFSFADYYDRNNMHFQTLRVINEDFVAPDSGFDTHPHKDMEIVTYIISGELAHRDSMGNTEVIKAGDFQAMTAGSGITHSEFNPSKDKAVHLLQIWILPNQKNLKPTYKDYSPEIKEQLNLIISKDGPLTINQDIELFLGKLKAGQTITKQIAKDRHLWIQQIEGSLLINEKRLNPGDAAAISEEDMANLHAESDSHFLLFDLNTY